MHRFLVLLTGVALGAGLLACGGNDEPSEAAADDDAGGGDGPRYEFVGTVLESAEHGPELCVGAVATSLPPQCGGVPVEPWKWDDVPGTQAQAGTKWVDVVKVVGTYDGGVFRLTEDPGEPPMQGGPAVDVAADFPPLCTSALRDADKTDDDDFQAVMAATNALTTLSATWNSNTAKPPADQVINVIVTEGAADITTELQALWGGGLCVVERPFTPTEAELAEIQGRVAEVLGVDVWASWTDPTRGVVVAQVTVASDEVRTAADKAFGAGVIELNPALRPVL